MALEHISVGVRSERPSTPYVSTISIKWKDSGVSEQGIYLTRSEAIETAVRILAMVSLLDPMDTDDIEQMLERVSQG